MTTLFFRLWQKLREQRLGISRGTIDSHILSLFNHATFFPETGHVFGGSAGCAGDPLLDSVHRLLRGGAQAGGLLGRRPQVRHQPHPDDLPRHRRQPTYGPARLRAQQQDLPEPAELLPVNGEEAKDLSGAVKKNRAVVFRAKMRVTTCIFATLCENAKKNFFEKSERTL